MATFSLCPHVACTHASLVALWVHIFSCQDIDQLGLEPILVGSLNLITP